MTTIDLHRIRIHNGSQDGGFEELCSQLARLDDRSSGLPLFRKGVGADGGLECFTRRPDGTETGWQAKYVFGWTPSLKGQLDKSIQTALTRHPQLKEFIVCLPFDLPDARKDDQQSALQRWEEWREAWIKKAGARDLTISLWGRSEIVARLTGPGAEMAGRLLYWFDSEVLTQDWFAERLRIANAALGARYVPADNVELTISEIFRSFAHTNDLSKELDLRTNRVMDAYRSVLGFSGGAGNASVTLLVEAMSRLSNAIEHQDFASLPRLPLGVWIASAKAALDATGNVRSGSSEEPSTETQRALVEFLYRLMGALSDLLEAFESMRWRAWNARSVFLTGEAGIGKSHLLGDLVESRVAAGAPGLLVLGSQFADDEPWQQLMKLVDFPSGRSVATFLAALDAAAESAGTRAIVCIDALNEKKGIEIWPSRLASFLAAAAPYPRVCVIVSCRSTFAEFLEDAIAGAEHLLEVTHEGFVDGDGQAAKKYLAKRGIAYVGTPNISPELNNPLFLRTICDLLDRQGRKSLPRGSKGIASLLESYFEAACEAVTRRMRLSPMKSIPQRALKALVEEMVRSGSGYIPIETASAIVEAIHPSSNKADEDLLAALVQEGVVDVEASYEDGDGPVSQVRFTFERFSDHRIASTVLDQLPDADAARSFFADDAQRQKYLFRPAGRGIASALAIQLAERYGVEILDLVQDERLARRLLTPFVESLLWRDQSKFSDRTWKLFTTHLDRDAQTDLIVAISTEPENRFNADFVFARLKDLPMPDRDEVWSFPIAVLGYEGHVRNLIDWVFASGFDELEDRRVELAATFLTLLFSTSHRVVRDRATVALATLLAQRLDLASRTVEKFSAFNDPYVRERLYAAVYGAMLQGDGPIGLAELAGAVYRIEFAARKPTPNILVRDYAAGIVEYAFSRGALTAEADVQRVRPPFDTDWQAQPVFDHEIEAFTQSYGNGHVGRDSIVSSVMDGDFGRYVVNGAVDDFSVTPLGGAPATMKSQFADWEARFLREASTESREAYAALKTAAEGAVDVPTWEKDPRRIALTAARGKFRETLNEAEWENYESEASNHVEVWMFSKREINDLPRTTYLPWAYRWICKRAHELGWSADKFASMERELSHGGRHDHEVERLGKKYQWLALYELVAHLGDTRIYLGGGFRQEAELFRGADQLGLRNIDPSLLVRETYYEGWKQWDPTWWAPLAPRFERTDTLGRLAWRDTDVDLINDQCSFDVVDPATGRQYLCLHGFARWYSGGSAERRTQQHRDSWYRVFCIVTRKADEATLISNLVNRALISPQSEPKVTIESGFVAEFPWRLQRQGEADWIEPEAWDGRTVPVLPTVSEYTREKSGYDHAINRTVGLMLPAPWLAESMGLRLQGGRSLAFQNPSTNAEFFDPSSREDGPSAALISKAAFFSHLDEKELAAVWVVAGEKGVYDDRDSHGWGGRLVHSTVYQRDGDRFIAHKWRKTELPSDEQLEGYLRGVEMPEGFDLQRVIKLYGRKKRAQAQRSRPVGSSGNT